MTASTATAAAHWDEKYATAVRSAWVQNPQVEREVYRRMTGEPLFWLWWLFNTALPKANRMLSIGCGDGSHEISVARSGLARHITAFDASPVAIDLARAAAASDDLPIDFSVRLFEDFIASPPPGTFDVILFSGSLHHVADLEGMMSTVRKLLAPGGRVVVNEYVGPIYQLYPQTQVDIVNRVLDATPAAFLLERDARLRLPSIEGIMTNDPSEGVRAPLIPILLPMYFTPKYERLCGGGLLHPIFDCLNGAKINDGSPESDAYVAMLIAMENELTAAGVLRNDFMFGIYGLD